MKCNLGGLIILLLLLLCLDFAVRQWFKDTPGALRTADGGGGVEYRIGHLPLYLLTETSVAVNKRYTEGIQSLVIYCRGLCTKHINTQYPYC